jgi:hypothetical protein
LDLLQHDALSDRHVGCLHRRSIAAGDAYPALVVSAVVNRGIFSQIQNDFLRSAQRFFGLIA